MKMSLLNVYFNLATMTILLGEHIMNHRYQFRYSKGMSGELIEIIVLMFNSDEKRIRLSDDNVMERIDISDTLTVVMRVRTQDFCRHYPPPHMDTIPTNNIHTMNNSRPHS